MKYNKIILIIAIFMMMIIAKGVKAETLPDVTDHQKVTIYIFRGSGCSHCYDFLDYFNDLGNKYDDYFEVKAYEVWKNSNNSSLMSSVRSSLSVPSDKTGVPLIVIGNDYYKIGFISDNGSEIINAALTAYQDKSYTDLVSKLASKGSYTEQTLKEACEAEGITVSDVTKDKSHDGIIVVAIFAVVIGGLILLIASSRKKD